MAFGTRCVAKTMMEDKKLPLIPNIGYFVRKKKMSMNTSVTLDKHFEQFIEKSIESGRYSSASEVIREGLRLVDERGQKTRVLRDALETGEKSGYVKNSDPVKHLENLNRNYNT